MNYKLYISPRSPFARRVRMVLEELGQPYEFEIIPVLESPPSFFQINPLGRVPVLITQTKETIVESAQILSFLKDRHGDHPLFANAAANTPRALQISGLSVGVIEYSVQYFLETLRMPGAVDPEVLEEYTSNIRRTLLALEDLLGDDAQNRCRPCDLDYATAVGYARLRVKMDWIDKFEKNFPRGWKVFCEIEKRPSFQKTLPVLT